MAVAMAGPCTSLSSSAWRKPMRPSQGMPLWSRHQTPKPSRGQHTAALQALPSVPAMFAAVTTAVPPLAAVSPLESIGAAASFIVSPGTIFGAVSALMVPVYGLMIFAPESKMTRSLVSSPVLPLVLSLLYIFLLGQAVAGGLVENIATILSSLRPPSFVPDIGAVAALFGNPVVTNLAWVHLLLLDFYQARAVLVDGIACRVPTGHSIALCFLFAPLGLLSHFITRALQTALSGGRRPAASLI